MRQAPNIDPKQEVGGIRRAAAKAATFRAVCLAAGYWLRPRIMIFPREPVDALILTLRVDLFVLLWVVIAVDLVLPASRQSTADVRDAGFEASAEWQGH
jgi:hypothetical protein